ncbi:MAG: hypothetical protein QOD30_397 [Actinomycetota bacterium]|nr:hypothetical protein [Actinomycetota bacterium]
MHALDLELTSGRTVRFVPLRYLEYEASRSVPNVVVDGSPNESTRLTLTHWPGHPAPDGFADDLSAQMAFRYLDSDMSLHGEAEVVTNNHFDQDGTVSIFALTSPDVALAHRDLLVDVASAGDFGTYRDRRAARISMVLSWWSVTEPDPFSVALDSLPALLRDPDAFRSLWEVEDASLCASEDAVRDGRISVVDEPELDLAIVTVDPSINGLWGHRFTARRIDGVHPMAINNVTDMSTVAITHGSRFTLTHRYETWVQYVSRPRPHRVALLPLARRLTSMDAVRWRADAVGDLIPTLSHEGASTLPPDRFLELAREHLRTAPPAWDPVVGRT